MVRMGGIWIHILSSSIFIIGFAFKTLPMLYSFSYPTIVFSRLISNPYSLVNPSIGVINP